MGGQGRCRRCADPSPPPQTISDPVQRAQAIQEIQEMKARIGRIEQALGLPAEPPPVQYSPALNKPRDHNLELYGFAQLDAIQDFKRVNPNWDATLRPSTHSDHRRASSAATASRSSASARSRLGVKATGMLAGKPYEAKFEFDLFGTGVDAGQTTIRIRHMYASWGPFLAGQTNTLFMDGDIFPNVIDYWGPAGMVFVRNPQIRFTFWDKDGLERRGRARASERRHRSRQHPPDRRGHRRQHPAPTRSCPT